MSLNIKPDIDVGNIITFVAVIGGFFWWAYTNARAWNQSVEKQAKDGSLRLLLKFLQEVPESTLNVQNLFNQFQAPESQALRRAYCGRNWKFDSFQQFEGAIYALQWESKIDFTSAHAVTFRITRPYESPKYDQWKRFIPTKDEIAGVVAEFAAIIGNNEIETWEVERLAEAAFRLAPEESSKILRAKLGDPDERMRRRAIIIAGRMVPDMVAG